MNKKIYVVLIVLTCLIVVTLFIYHRFFSKQTVNSPVISTSSCIVLNESACDTGTYIKYSDKFFGIGFNLESDNPLFAPYDGVISLNDEVSIDSKKYNSIYLTKNVEEKNIPQEHLLILVSHQSVNKEMFDLQESGFPVYIKKGQQIATAGNQKVGKLGNYNVILSFMKIGSQNRTNEHSLELTKNYFKNIHQ